ncbi:MAG: hypothetical protein ACD_79C01166G0001, partial [uncultured bacterium]
DKHNKITSAINLEIEQDSLKIKEEIDPILSAVFPESDLSEINEASIDELPENQFNELIIKEVIQIQDIENIFEFKIMLKNLIKRRQYISYDVQTYLTEFKNKFISILSDNTKSEQDVREILEDMIYKKGLEIQARLFDEFEGRNRGLKYFYTEMDGMGSIPTEPYYYDKNLGGERFLPDKDRVSLMEASKNEKDLQIFQYDLMSFMKRAVLNVRHHKLIEKEFFDVVCEQCINFDKGKGSSFWDQFGYLWGTEKFPLMATIDGDELRIVFKGPDGNTYPLCFDFNNFQACDISLRKMFGAPYLKDDLLFRIHEGIIKTLINKINEFKNSPDFANDYEKIICPSLLSETPQNVIVDLNPYKQNSSAIKLQKRYFNELEKNLKNGNINFIGDKQEITLSDYAKDKYQKEELQREIRYNKLKLDIMSNSDNADKLKLLYSELQKIDLLPLRVQQKIKEGRLILNEAFALDKSGTPIAPKLEIPLSMYFFEGLSKTENSGRKEKGQLATVNIAGATMKGILKLNHENYFPSLIFAKTRDKLDNMLSKLKKMGFNGFVIMNSNNLSTSEILNEGKIISVEDIEAQNKIMEDRKKFFAASAILTDYLKATYPEETVSDNTHKFSQIIEFLYKMKPDSWELVTSDKTFFLYDKEHFTEAKTRFHLNNLEVNYKEHKFLLGAIPEAVNKLIDMAKNLDKEFKASFRTPNSKDFATAA